MLSVLISVVIGLVTGAGAYFTDVLGWGWSLFTGLLGFGAAQLVQGRILQKRVKAAMDAVQSVLVEGQKKLQAKTARWQLRPPGSLQAAQQEIARDQKVFVTEALARTEALVPFKPWVPLMARQIATARFQLYWMIKDFKHVDELMPQVLFLDPAMTAMKLARLHMCDRPTAEITKIYEKAVRRLRYNQNVLLASTYAWILLRRGDADGAFKSLNRALEKSDDETLKVNRDHLANNRLAHFSNAALGEQWYALFLEEPKIRQPRQRMQWR